ncbi:MAG: MotA/TolQ/ExbB proton channel family protein, partial [Planctomycetales bacterium]|nr:MotA/TolQ/ExbB proton channel family protein [Planctomycetales bacterium]
MTILRAIMFSIISLAMADAALAQTVGADVAVPDSTPAPRSLFEIIFSGGWTGALIVIVLFGLSLFVAALVVEHSLTIRASILMPPRLAEKVRSALMAGDLRTADEACQAEPSFLAFVLRAGMAEATEGWSAVEKALEDATAEQAARLFRKIEFLSVMGNIAPMVGLLGTVTGMIFAFQEVAESQGAARAAELAEGIYQALVTT